MGNWIKTLIMVFPFILSYAGISAQIYEDAIQTVPAITSESPFDWNGEYCIKDKSKWKGIEVGPDPDQHWVTEVIINAEGVNDQEPAKFFREQSNSVMIGINTLSGNILDEPSKEGLLYAFTAYLKKNLGTKKRHH